MIRILNKSRARRRSLHLLWIAAGWASSAGLTAASMFAQDSQPRFPLTSSQVLAAMKDQELSAFSVKIKMAAPVTASTSNAQLDVTAVVVVNPQELRLRMACRRQAECLPFFVQAKYSQPVDVAELQARLSHQVLATPAERAGRLPVSGETAHASAAEGAHPDDLQEPSRLKAGSAAMLNLDGGRVHISVKVICLESGAIGDKIRVSSRDRKQSYMAQIISPELLKGDI